MLTVEGNMKRLIACLAAMVGIITLFGCANMLKDIAPIAGASESAGQLGPVVTTPNTQQAPTTSKSTSQQPAELALSAVSLTGPAGDLRLPEITGLNIKLDQPSGSAEYLDSQGRTMLLVDAISLKDGSQQSAQLKQLLDQIYGPASPYLQNSVYPRFHFPIQGVQAGFFAIDKNLTASQVLLLKSALELFSRPMFASMQPDLFDPSIAYILIDKIAGDTAGLTYAGTGVVELDRRDLFGNKYLLASVIAHEGSHVLQGPETDNADCAEQLSREVGNQTIPADFYQWDGTTLLQAIKDRQIGAYHVSLWMLFRLGVKDTAWIVQAIKTGTVNGGSVVNCK